MKNYITAAQESPNVPITDKMTFERILSFANIYKSTMPLVNYAAFMLLRQYEGLNDDAEKKANTDELEEYASKMFPIEIIENTFAHKDALTPVIVFKDYANTTECFHMERRHVKKSNISEARHYILAKVLRSDANESRPIMDEVIEFQQNYASIPMTIQSLCEGGGGVDDYCAKYDGLLKEAYSMFKKDNLTAWQNDEPKIPSGTLTHAACSQLKACYLYTYLDAQNVAQITSGGLSVIRYSEDQAGIFFPHEVVKYFAPASAKQVESTLRGCKKVLGEAFSSLKMLAEMGERVKNEFLEYQKAQSAKK